MILKLHIPISDRCTAEIVRELLRSAGEQIAAYVTGDVDSARFGVSNNLGRLDHGALHDEQGNAIGGWWVSTDDEVSR